MGDTKEDDGGGATRGDLEGEVGGACSSGERTGDWDDNEEDDADDGDGEESDKSSWVWTEEDTGVIFGAGGGGGTWGAVFLANCKGILAMVFHPNWGLGFSGTGLAACLNAVCFGFSTPFNWWTEELLFF